MFTPLLAITFALMVSLIASEIARHFKYPRIVGQIVAGIIIGLPVFHEIMTESALADIEFLSELGIIFLFLVIGMEIDLKHLKQEKRRAIIVGGVSVAVPLVMGFYLGKWLGYENLTSLVVGVCLAITSETVNSQLFMEMNVAKKRLVKIIFGSALIADLFAILFLTFFIPVLDGDLQKIAVIPIKIIGFMAIMWGLTRVMPYFVTHFEQDESNVAEVALMSVFGLVVATLSIQLGLGEMIGAFLGGIILQASLYHKCTDLCAGEAKSHQRHIRFFKRNIQVLKIMTLGFVIPFFFINLGLKLDFESIGHAPWTVLIMVVVGIISKFIAAAGVRRWTHFNNAQTVILALGMNTRGMIGLVVAEVALENGVLNAELYGALLVTVMVTILMFPLSLRAVLKKHPRAMDLNKNA